MEYSGDFETERNNLEKILNPLYARWSVEVDGPGYVARAWFDHSTRYEEAWSVEWDDEWEFGEKEVKACPARALYLLRRVLEAKDAT